MTKIYIAKYKVNNEKVNWRNLQELIEPAEVIEKMSFFEMDVTEYNEARQDTVDQLEDFGKSLEKMKSGEGGPSLLDDVQRIPDPDQSDANADCSRKKSDFHFPSSALLHSICLSRRVPALVRHATSSHRFSRCARKFPPESLVAQPPATIRRAHGSCLQPRLRLQK